MIRHGHSLPCYFAGGFCKPTTKTASTLVWFSDDFCLIFTLQDFIGQMTKIEDRYWIETDSFVHSPHSIKLDATSGIEGTAHPYVHVLHTQTQIILVFHVLKFFQTLKLCVVNLTLLILHNTLISL